MVISDIRCSNAIDEISNRLSHPRCREDALEAILEAVDLRWRLVADYPATFNADIAQPLNSLSSCLGHLGCQEDVLEANSEVLNLC